MKVQEPFHIKYFDFPYDFDSEDNLLQDCLLDLSESLPKNLSLDVYGSYPSTRLLIRSLKYFKSKVSDSGMVDWLSIHNGYRKPLRAQSKNLWWTFENRRPPSGIFDGTISFDLDSYSDSNFYLPLIYQYLDISGKGGRYVKHKKTVLQCMEHRQISIEQVEKRNGFVSVFMNNPHPMRIRAIERLSKFGEVSVFGRYNGKYVQDKVGTASQYKFNLCFENDLYPGYVTEKVLEAWLSKSVPLYWGDDAAGILNQEAIVNLRDFSSMKSFIEHIEFLHKSPEKMAKIISQPLFSKNCDYEKLQNFILRSIS
jgi:hypothetical protein